MAEPPDRGDSGDQRSFAPSPRRLEELGGPSFEDVYRRYFHNVQRWARYLGGYEADIDDLTQEVFLTARDKIRREEILNVPAWLFQITRRTLSDYRRWASLRYLFRAPESALSFLEAADGSPEALERRWIIESALARLSPTLRTTFILFEWEGYTAEEVAALQDEKVSTIHSRIRLARTRFLKWTHEKTEVKS